MPRLSRTLTAISAISAGALFLAGCSASGAVPQESTGGPVSLAVGVTPIANAAHVYIAEQQGFFDEENLDVTATTIQTAATAIPSLLNNELQMALMTSVPIVTAASKGLPIRVVSGSDRYPLDPKHDTTALVAAPGSGVGSVKELSGKTVAVVGLKSAPELALRVLLKDSGVDPEQVKVVEIAYPDMVPALTADRVDAAFIVDPFLSKAEAAGLPVIGRPFTDGIGGMSALQWVASDAFTKSNPDAVQRFTKAMKRAGEYANEHPEAVREVLPEFTSLSPKAIEKTVIPTYDTKLGVEDIQAFADLMTKEGFINDGYDPAELIWTP